MSEPKERFFYIEELRRCAVGRSYSGSGQRDAGGSGSWNLKAKIKDALTYE